MGNIFSMVFIMWYVLSVFNLYARDVIYQKIFIYWTVPLGVERQFWRPEFRNFIIYGSICIFSEIVVFGKLFQQFSLIQFFFYYYFIHWPKIMIGVEIDVGLL